MGEGGGGVNLTVYQMQNANYLFKLKIQCSCRANIFEKKAKMK